MAEELDFVEEELDLEGEDDTLRRFKPLISKERHQRSAFIDELQKSLAMWSLRAKEDALAQHLLDAHLPTILRLSCTCPFSDVRERCAHLLQDVQMKGIIVPRPVFDGPSSFIPKSEISCYYSTGKTVTPELQIIFENGFVRDARLSHMVSCLSDHPQYLDLFIQTLDFIMNGDGPLGHDIRSYIAILAASRHKCAYLVTYQEMEFLGKGGDSTWLKGIQNLPAKIFNLLQFNKMLCHQPWYITDKHFEALLIGRDSWSVAELVHALVIMSCFHCLAGFCLGCGLNPELDTELGHVISDQSEINVPQCTNPALGMGGTPRSDSEGGSEVSSPTSSPPNPDVSKYLVQHFIETSGTGSKRLADTIKEKLAVVSQEEDDDEEEEDMDRQFAESVSSFGMEKMPSLSVPTPVNLTRYLTESNYEHEDFTLTSARTLRAREYSWEDHGFSFLSSLYPQLSDLLDDKFKVAAEMTYRHVGDQKDIDTKPFREATWYYIQSIKGIRHDDYNYGKVNKILDIQYKTYIRMVACFPEKVTQYDFVNCMTGLAFSERVHVNVLVQEARLQAQLIYALKALMEHMK